MSIIQDKSVDFDKIYDVLWESISEALEIEVMRENQAGARPPVNESGTPAPYATILINPGPEFTGIDEERFASTTDGMSVETVGQKELTLSINIYRKGARSLMARLQKLMQTRIFKDTLYLKAQEQDFELQIIEALSSQDLSELLQSNYEERAQMDVALRTTSSITQSLDPIESVGIDYAIKNEADEIVEDGELNINP